MAPKTIAFFGASGGVGLAALKHSLAAGHHCIALCRNPSRLTAVLPPETTPNLTVLQGNVRDAGAVARCLLTTGDSDGDSSRLVDQVVFTVGSRPTKMMQLEDPHVCEAGMAAVLEAVADLRKRDASSSGGTRAPHIVACSSTGISRFGRDVPLPMVPLYHVGLRAPHADKRLMEDGLAASGEAFTIVRPSLLFDGGGSGGGDPDGTDTDTLIRVGVEDPGLGVLESKAVGYRISREDVGKWIARNLVLDEGEGMAKYRNKNVTVTY
ncbi:hypothetical protein SLS62_008075 [Diatrype stigma]|uniref:NAD(P)-binding domain-containing protein n=1 Tax=Diatrype stigma TaxID=117547 RepID=A0AAN9ULL3_9PEZI